MPLIAVAIGGLIGYATFSAYMWGKLKPWPQRHGRLFPLLTLVLAPVALVVLATLLQDALLSTHK